MNEPNKKKRIMDGVGEIENTMDRAQFTKQQAVKVGFVLDDSVAGTFVKIAEEFDELKAEVESHSSTSPNIENLQGEMGDLLFSICGLANKLGIKAEDCLQMTIDKFVFRTGYVEDKLLENGQDFSNGNMDNMCVWWEDAKKVK